MPTTQAKNITVSITLVASLALGAGSMILTMMRENNATVVEGLKEDITRLEAEIEELENSDATLHRRISDVSERQRSLETNLAGYNAKLDAVQAGLVEIKGDIKELSRVDIGTAIRNALNDWTRGNPPAPPAE